MDNKQRSKQVKNKITKAGFQSVLTTQCAIVNIQGHIYSVKSTPLLLLDNKNVCKINEQKLKTISLFRTTTKMRQRKTNKKIGQVCSVDCVH